MIKSYIMNCKSVIRSSIDSFFEEMKDWSIRLRLELNGLSQYSLNLAPAELNFEYIKQKIRRRKDCKNVNFSKQEGVDPI